jgi:hypothetical protein
MKLQRAEEHLGQLRDEHERFIRERNPYRMLREDDVEPGYYIWRAKIVEAPPLEKWASLAGECVHALRSALDHVAYELVQINRPTYEHAEFPIFKDRIEWQKRCRGKLPGVDRKVLAQVQWLQPYRRWNVSDPLWLVHELDIVDKHRRLNLVSPILRQAQWIPLGGDVTDIERFAGPFEDGTPVARFKMVPDNSNMHMQTNFVFDVALTEGVLQGHPLMARLESLRTYIGGVVARFDRFFV